MINSKGLTSAMAVVLSVLFITAGLWAQTEDVLSGRDLLRVIRDKDGRGQKPAYENRLKKPIEAKAEEPLVGSVDTKPAPGTSPEGDGLLQMIPAESLFCVRVNNFDYTLSQIDQFLAGVSPMPMGLSILARTQFAKILGSPELTGVKMGGSFAVFGPLVSTDMTDLDNIAVLVPVTDYKEFISGNTNVGQPDQRGISKITSEGMHPLLVTQVKDYALISPQGNDSELITTAKSIQAGAAGLPSALDTAEAEKAVTEPIWTYGNVQQASKTFGPLLFGKIEEVKEMMEEMKSSGQAPMADCSAVFNMYAAILETLMKETKSLSISINPKPTVLNITETILALPGTNMADMFTADTFTKQENKLLGYLEDGAVMNVSGRATTKLNAEAMDFFATAISKIMQVADTARIKSLASGIATAFSGNDAMSFFVDPKSKPPFAGKYVIEIKDKGEVNKVIEEGAELFNTGGIADFYESLGLKASYTLSRGTDSYKGVSIDSAKFVLKPTDVNSPQGQMIAAMYGDGFNYRWGAVDGLWVCAFGGDVDSVIRELIDQVRAGSPKQISTELKAAFALLPDAADADFVATFNFLRYFKMITAMMGAMMPVPMPQVDIPTKSNIVLAGKIGGGKMTIDIAVPKEHLTEIMAAFQMMQQKMMMQQQEMMQDVQAQTDKARVTTTKANLKILHSAVVEFKMDTGRYPTDEEGLMALIEQPSDVKNYPPGGYLETTQIPKDGWGRDFIYELWPEDAKPFRIVSLGADGKEGGEGYNADLSSGAN